MFFEEVSRREKFEKNSAELSQEKPDYPAGQALDYNRCHSPALACPDRSGGSVKTSHKKISLHPVKVDGIAVGERKIQHQVLRVNPIAAEWLRLESPAKDLHSNPHPHDFLHFVRHLEMLK